MGRTRAANSHGNLRRRNRLDAANAIVSLACLACSEVAGDFDRVIAIQLPLPLVASVEEGDTTTLQAQALSASGEIVPDAQIVWAIIDVDSGQIGFTIDTASGLIRGTHPGSGRVQARLENENLRSDPLLVTVTPAPDSMSAVSATRLLTAAMAEQSPPLTVRVLDLTSQDTPVGLAGKQVSFSIVVPANATGIFLTVTDTVPQADRSELTVISGATGDASAFLRRVPGESQPDSAVVEVSANTAAGQLVAGSPIRFVVEFEPAGTN